MEQTPDFHTPWKPSFLGSIRNILNEIWLHLLRHQKQKSLPRLIVLPSGTPTENPASLLRAYKIAESLAKFYGWRVTVIPPRFTLKQRLRIIKWEKADVILMQMERHPLNRPKFYNACPVIFDIDDADFLWDYARPIVEECCKDADLVTAGSTYVAEWASPYNSNVRVIWTGANYPDTNFRSQLARKPIVAWGHSRPQHYLAEAEFIQDILIEVAKQTEVEYWAFGVNDEETKKLVTNKVSKAKINVKTFSSMSFEEFIVQLENTAIGIQFLSPDNTYSQGKSFGKILNYILAGTVVVASNSAEHPKFFSHQINGMLAQTKEEWVDAIVYLLNSPNQRKKLSENAYASYLDKLSINAVSAKYDLEMRNLLN